MKDVAAMARFGMLLVLLLILPVTYSSVTTNPTDSKYISAISFRKCFHEVLICSPGTTVQKQFGPVLFDTPQALFYITLRKFQY
jgi:hypothetical protein